MGAAVTGIERDNREMLARILSAGLSRGMSGASPCRRDAHSQTGGKRQQRPPGDDDVRHSPQPKQRPRRDRRAAIGQHYGAIAFSVPDATLAPSTIAACVTPAATRYDKR